MRSNIRGVSVQNPRPPSSHRCLKGQRQEGVPLSRHRNNRVGDARCNVLDAVPAMPWRGFERKR